MRSPTEAQSITVATALEHVYMRPLCAIIAHSPYVDPNRRPSRSLALVHWPVTRRLVASHSTVPRETLALPQTAYAPYTCCWARYDCRVSRRCKGELKRIASQPRSHGLHLRRRALIWVLSQCKVAVAHPLRPLAAKTPSRWLVGPLRKHQHSLWACHTLPSLQRVHHDVLDSRICTSCEELFIQCILKLGTFPHNRHHLCEAPHGCQHFTTIFQSSMVVSILQPSSKVSHMLTTTRNGDMQATQERGIMAPTSLAWWITHHAAHLGRQHSMGPQCRLADTFPCSYPTHSRRSWQAIALCCSTSQASS